MLAPPGRAQAMATVLCLRVFVVFTYEKPIWAAWFSGLDELLLLHPLVLAGHRGWVPVRPGPAWVKQLKGGPQACGPSASRAGFEDGLVVSPISCRVAAVLALPALAV